MLISKNDFIFYLFLNMFIRKVNQSDCQILFNWRNDPLTKKMFKQNNEFTYKDHCKWLNNAILDHSRYLYIGELDGDRLGFSRFDYRENIGIAEISINLNPKYRGKGFGQEFLLSSIDSFHLEKECDLVANIKKENIASQKIFKKAGFDIVNQEDNLIKFKSSTKHISFKKVSIKDSKLLYDLLKKRFYSISHKAMPSFKMHEQFVSNSPYLHWYLIFNNKDLIGSFYLKDDNSIGINILKPSLIILKKIMFFINSNFSALPSMPSKVPPYFYINVAEKNNRLKEIFIKMGFDPIQTSFRFKK